MENKKDMRKWLNDFELDHPLVIGGPCSAETEEQVLKVANQLKDSDVTVFRAGIWKPRTRPGMFEGVAAIGLNWLKKVKEQKYLIENMYQYYVILQKRLNLATQSRPRKKYFLPFL